MRISVVRLSTRKRCFYSSQCLLSCSVWLADFVLAGVNAEIIDRLQKGDELMSMCQAKQPLDKHSALMLCNQALRQYHTAFIRYFPVIVPVFEQRGPLVATCEAASSRL